MRSPNSIFGLSVLGFAAASSCTGIQWGPCPAALKVANNSMCAGLDVPMDYTAPKPNETLTLKLLKLPAPIQPAKGSILFNFGGPGQTARDALGNLGDRLLPMTGDQYDLVTFDPRGTGDTIPFNWYASEAEFATAQASQPTSNESAVALGRAWSRGAVDAWLAENRMNHTGRLISTAFGARDLISIVDALDEPDGQLRFWGQSYGTTLGMTAAAMFPDRVDKLILDAVQNPHDYYHAQATYEQWASADGHFSAFFAHCVAHREQCLLAQLFPRNATASQLEQAAWDLLERVKAEPIVLPGGPGAAPTLLDYTLLKSTFSTNFYAPQGKTDSWPVLGGFLYAAMSPELATPQLPTPVPDQRLGHMAAAADTIALRGIQCGDNRVRTATFEGFAGVLEDGLAQSRILGDLNMPIHVLCAQWTIEPAEVYEGGFDDLRIGDEGSERPVLVLANTYDAHTSIKSAHNVSATFANSVVLETEGFGHAMLANPSRCAAEYVKAYWTEGVLPEVGTVCDSIPSPFSNITWDDLLVDL